MGAVFEWPVRVYYEDTDAGGVVYHASYLRFLERARTEWLRGAGVQQSHMAERHRRVFAITELAVKFRKPARLDDELVATCQLSGRGGASLRFRQRLIRCADQALLVEAEVRAACVDLDRLLPAPIPKNYLQEH